MNDNLISKGIEEFLNYIRETERTYREALSDEQKANTQTQDILHALELNNHNYHDTAKLAVKLTEIRKERRSAKDLTAKTLPVVEWAKNNRSILNSLEQLLGKVRKEEKNIRDRFYTPRTETVKNILGDEK